MKVKWRPKELLCESCEKVFVQKVSGQKYCSHECRNLAYDTKTIGNKFLIHQRDGFRCAYCGSRPLEDDVKLILDHLIPYSRGGQHTAGNLITACSRCNLSKHAKTLPAESLEYFLGYVKSANTRYNIPHDKVIEGPHTRGEYP